MPFHPTISGQLIDALGSGVSGASLTFISRATTQGLENVAKTAAATYSANDSGFYSFAVPSGRYEIFYQEPEYLAPARLGFATVEGVGPYDVGTLIGNSIPPPSQLDQVTDVSTTGKVDGSLLVWDLPSRRWQATPHRAPGQLYRTTETAANVGGVFENLHTYSIPANTLPRDGDRLQISASFTTSGAYATTAEKRIRAYIGSALVYDVSALNYSYGPVNVGTSLVLTRTSATTANVYASTSHDDYSPPPFYSEPLFTGFALTHGSAQTLRFSVSGLNPRSIIQNETVLSYSPAP